MAHEIERKFLLVNDDWRRSVSHSVRMCQGYLATTEAVSIRIRQEGEQAFLNLKSATLGITRDEFEFPLPVAGALEVLHRFCAGRCIDKTRHYVPMGQHLWEIDEFAGANAGLIVAEIELTSEDELFERPAWLGREVSLERRYYNVCLVDQPYSAWPVETRPHKGGQAAT